MLLSLQDQLQTLNQVDLQLRGLRSRVDARSRRLDTVTTKLNQFQQQQTELEQQVSRARARVQGLENQVETAEGRINQLRERMNNTSSNKEYSAMLVEVNTLKAEKSKLEEQALELMQEVEQLDTRLAEVRDKAVAQEKVTTAAQGELDEANADIKDRLEELQKERDAAANVIDDNVLREYERLSHTHDGESLAEIEEQNRRRMEYNCGACFMSIPIERVSAVMSNPDTIVHCPNCSRILTISAELREAIVPSKD